LYKSLRFPGDADLLEQGVDRGRSSLNNKTTRGERAMAWTSGDFEELLTARAAVAFVFGEEFTQQYLVDAVRDRDIVYAALKSEDERMVWGLVLFIKREGERLHIKRISEDMGPYDDRCPSRILDLLTEPINEMAGNWRARCRDRGQRPKSGA
jgi:hypothetical protein